MTTMTMERLEEIATAWRRGLDADELTNPAGPIFTGDAYTEYDIAATGSNPPWTVCTVVTSYNDPGLICACCPL